jgi:hypothetical protein
MRSIIIWPVSGFWITGERHGDRATADRELWYGGGLSYVDVDAVRHLPSGFVGLLALLEQAWRRYARRYRRQHEGRRRPLPGFCRRARPPDRSARAHQSVPETKQNVTPLPLEGRELLALSAYVARRSRGLAIRPSEDPRLEPFRARGRDLYERRQGQLNFSCANCYDDNWGQKIGSSVIPQGHPTGYPLYRFEWQGMGSCSGGCATAWSARAEPFPYGPTNMWISSFS